MTTIKLPPTVTNAESYVRYMKEFAEAYTKLIGQPKKFVYGKLPHSEDYLMVEDTLLEFNIKDIV